MPDKKVLTYDDLDNFSRELIRLIYEKYKELNTNKDIVHPTEQAYEELSKDAANNSIAISRCLGIYVGGRNKGKRCQASPHTNSKYCLNHINQAPKYKKEQHENEIKLLREKIESLESSLND